MPFLTVWSVKEESQSAEVLFDYDKDHVEGSQQYWDVLISNITEANRLISTRKEREVSRV